jgi:hypothetical protein
VVNPEYFQATAELGLATGEISEIFQTLPPSVPQSIKIDGVTTGRTPTLFGRSTESDTHR